MSSISFTIGIGGAIPFLLIFVLINKKDVSFFKLLIVSVIIYLLSCLSSYVLFALKLAGNFNTAYYIPGFFAPIFYSVIAHFLVRRYMVQIEKDKSDYDHFIE